jgi:nitrogenase iron protein NifH
MERIAIYGKGGIGKSVVATALSAYYGMSGKSVLHIGCDPKHDSAIRLIDNQDDVRTVLEVLGDNPHADLTQEILNLGRHGIHCCEAGGPPAGLGCGGRGVARTIEYLDETEFLLTNEYDVVVFDVLGDVVCGGFAAPLRKGFAEKLLIVVSEEPMAIFAANNVARAVETYHRNGVVLAGLVINCRSPDVDTTPIERFAEKIGTRVLTMIERDSDIMKAERQRLTIVEYKPESNAAKALVGLGEAVAALDKKSLDPPTPMTDKEFFAFMADWGGA